MSVIKALKPPLVFEPRQLVLIETAWVTAGCFALCGEVQATDEHGVRLTLVDWLMGDMVGWDIFLPWNQILNAVIATTAHDQRGFVAYAGKEQERIHARREKEYGGSFNEDRLGSN